MKCSAWFAALALSAGMTATAFGGVSGVVVLDGKPPERQPVAGMANVPQCAAQHKVPPLDETVVADKDGNLANVVVYLEAEGLTGPVPKDPVIIDQKGCQYIPHVVSVTCGQPLQAASQDALLHNVHTLPVNNDPVNVAMPVPNPGMNIKSPKAAEIYKVKCDVHPWMNAWIAAFEHPYHTVTKEDGFFEIKTEGLKPGKYKLVAWHEKFKKSEPIEIEVPANGNFEVKDPIVFKQGAAAAPAAEDVKVVKIEVKATKECCDKCETKDAKTAPVAATK